MYAFSKFVGHGRYKKNFHYLHAKSRNARYTCASKPQCSPNIRLKSQATKEFYIVSCFKAMWIHGSSYGFFTAFFQQPLVWQWKVMPWHYEDQMHIFLTSRKTDESFWSCVAPIMTKRSRQHSHNCTWFAGKYYIVAYTTMHICMRAHKYAVCIAVCCTIPGLNKYNLLPRFILFAPKFRQANVSHENSAAL